MISCTGPKIIQINLEKYPPIINEFNEVLNKYARYSYTDNDIILLSDIELNRIIRIYEEMFLDKEVYYKYCDEIEKAMRDSLNKTVNTNELFYAADPRRVRLKIQKTIESKKGKLFYFVLEHPYILKAKVCSSYTVIENDNGFILDRKRYLVKIIDNLNIADKEIRDTLDVISHLGMKNLNIGSEYILVVNEWKGDYGCGLVDQELTDGVIRGKNWEMGNYYSWYKFKKDFRNKYNIK